MKTTPAAVTEPETTTAHNNLLGIGFLLLAVLINSLQAVAVKAIGPNYSALEIVTLRTLVALPLTLLFFRLEGGRGLPRTQRRKLEYVRGLMLFLSYTTYMMGLASLQLADVEAIRFSAPLMITVLSVVLLREKVELRRWLALLVGFSGILLVMKPGSASFNLGSVFVLISVLFYALTVMLTRKLQPGDSSATMAYYSALVYLLGGLVFSPLAAAAAGSAQPDASIAFLFHPWTMPTRLDLGIMFGLGLVWAGWTYFMTRAYSVGQASVVAPFEYASLPISVMWGIVIFHTVPSLTTILGALLTLASGLYLLYQGRK